MRRSPDAGEVSIVTTMNCSNSQSWTQKSEGLWVARDSDGYMLQVCYAKGAWRWGVRPPGGGYDVFSGNEPEAGIAREKADAALRGLMHEILEAREKARKAR
jgi:hypothetical protein